MDFVEVKKKSILAYNFRVSSFDEHKFVYATPM